MTQSSLAHELLVAQRAHLAKPLQDIQRCVYFLDASDATPTWPLTGDTLSTNKKNANFFKALAAVNERFSKLPNILWSAMRHSLLLSGEQADSFLKVLANFQKHG